MRPSASRRYEIRDPVYGFIGYNDLERDIINSKPFQRLRRIKQLAMTHLVYPGAVHTRFEHGLGTMEIATRAFDILAERHRDLLSALLGWDAEEMPRAKQVLRLGALLHDVGHAPFSHGPEDLLPPTVKNHEEFTKRFLMDASSELHQILLGHRGPFNTRPEDVAIVALGPRKLQTDDIGLHFLGELVAGSIGVDRMDYLVRDSLHTGVAYGRFDYQRLLYTLTLGEAPNTRAPTLAVEEGGLQTLEGLLLARYFMFQQMYYHDVRAVYDIHLREFLQAILPEGHLPESLEDYLQWDDPRVEEEIRQAELDERHPGHNAAQPLTGRRHFRLACELTSQDLAGRPSLFQELWEAALGSFPSEAIRQWSSNMGSASVGASIPTEEIWIKSDDGQLADVLNRSELVQQLPTISKWRVYSRVDVRSAIEHFTRTYVRAKLGGPTSV